MLSSKLLEALQGEVARDCAAFLPELILCGGIVLLLLLRLFSSLDRLHMGWVAVLISALALTAACSQWAGCCLTSPADFLSKNNGKSDIFGGMLVYDYFTVFLRVFLLAFSMLVIVLTLLTRIPDKEDSADFHTLILGATLGMMVMAATNHLLMMFIGVEMASLPSYALAGYLKGRKQSSEAALKYVVYGGGAAGVMLYGISLLAGKFGTAYLPDLAIAYGASINAGGFDPILVLGTLFVLIGVAFKLAAVPFHFWCPDVFEGASAEVAGFLSVASKAAAVALLARIVFAFSGVAYHLPTARTFEFLVPALAVLGIITATFGNLAAFRQTNLKRLLAYSTIAHAGYMIMSIATLKTVGVKAALVYLVAYLLMNLGAFAIVAFLRNQTGSEELADYRGMVRRSPGMTIALSIFLLSLLGVPPLVGFVAKIEIFMALWQTASDPATAPGIAAALYTAFFFLGLNSVISAVYYLKVMKVMIIEERVEDVEGKEAQPLPEPLPAKAYAFLLSLVVLAGIAFWTPIEKASVKGSGIVASKAGKPIARVDVSKGDRAVNDARSLDTLQQIVRRESRSLMQYVAGAYPWTDSTHEAAEHHLRGIIQSEHDHLVHLTRFLYRHKIAPPHGGGYATDFTSLNFLGLEHLVSLLMAHQQENIAALEADLTAITDPEGRQLAEKFLAVKKKHLEDFRQLQPEAAVTP